MKSFREEKKTSQRSTCAVQFCFTKNSKGHTEDKRILRSQKTILAINLLIVKRVIKFPQPSFEMGHKITQPLSSFVSLNIKIHNDKNVALKQTLPGQTLPTSLPSVYTKSANSVGKGTPKTSQHLFWRATESSKNLKQ